MAEKKSLTQKEIAYADWERNYKDSGVSFEEASQNVWNMKEAGWDLSRSGNTLFMTLPEDDSVRFHTITADRMEDYLAALEKFFMMLYLSRKVKRAYTFIEDKKTFEAAKKRFGDAVSVKDNTQDPSRGKFLVEVDIDSLEQQLLQKAKKAI
jgi:hypothetical protein